MAEYEDLKEADEEQIDPGKLLEIQLEEKFENLSPCLADGVFGRNEGSMLHANDGPAKKRGAVGTGSLRCDKCQKVYKNHRSFLSHIDIAHRVSYEVPFKCKLCSRTITTRPGVNKHIARHLESPEKVCPKCGKKFYVTARLRHHLKACLQTLGELCTFCGIRFNYVSSLRRHIRTMHCKDKDYVCKECGKTFKLLRYLKRHEIIHTSLKPFRCKFCDRDFNRSANLDVHIRLHTGVKPYRCDVCGLSFTHNVSCKKHRLKHFADTL